jgi:hypothetical protein
VSLPVAWSGQPFAGEGHRALWCVTRAGGEKRHAVLEEAYQRTAMKRGRRGRSLRSTCLPGL